MSRIYQYKKLLSQYDTILFDLDGTLYNSELFYSGAFEDMSLWLVKNGLQERSDSWSDCVMGLKRARGNDYGKLFDDALEILNIDVRVKTRLLKKYRGHDCRYLRLDDRELRLLDYLQGCGKKMFIVTNGQRQLQERKIQKLKLTRYMEEVIILDPSEEIRLKPDRDVFDRLCTRYVIGKTIMVGDRYDIDGMFAHNAGIDFVGVGFYGN